MKKQILLTLMFALVGFSYGQESQYPHQVLSKPSNQAALITQHLKDLFGEHYNTYGSNDEAVAFYTDFYDRCEFLTANEIPAIVPNISTLMVKSKYNPEVIFHDNISVFNIETFNVFKYNLNFNSSQNLYYRIYNTNTVLKINKKIN
ncbi:MAG TPA: hypothetical protein VL021_06860 [Brumimicrobium sp.]|nr:hypothetical protein [Brumimicrobium sp.]